MGGESISIRSLLRDPRAPLPPTPLPRTPLAQEES